MTPLKLNDDELKIICDAAHPLPVHMRDRFLQEISRELVAEKTIGVGVLHRICAEVQRRLFDPPLAAD
jgi:hypothetical protein